MAQFKTQVTSYGQAAEFLGNRNGRTIAHNTTVERRSADFIAVQLYGTDVVGFHADGRVVLRSGGWETVTTKDRINACLPGGYAVTQKDFAWSLHEYGPDGVDVPFTDGMVVNA
jgi:hypothetical protein